MNHIFCILSSGMGHLGCFQLLAIINKASMNIVEHVSLLQVGTSFGYVSRSGIAGSSGNTMFNFLRNHQADFQSACTSLQSHQQWRNVPLSPHPHQHLLSPEILTQPFWLVWSRISRLFWFAFPWWLKMLNISLGASQPFEFPQLRILYLALFPIFNRVICFSGV